MLRLRKKKRVHRTVEGMQACMQGSTPHPRQQAWQHTWMSLVVEEVQHETFSGSAGGQGFCSRTGKPAHEGNKGSFALWRVHRGPHELLSIAVHRRDSSQARKKGGEHCPHAHLG